MIASAIAITVDIAIAMCDWRFPVRFTSRDRECHCHCDCECHGEYSRHCDCDARLAIASAIYEPRLRVPLPWGDCECHFPWLASCNTLAGTPFNQKIGLTLAGTPFSQKIGPSGQVFKFLFCCKARKREKVPRRCILSKTKNTRAVREGRGLFFSKLKNDLFYQKEGIFCHLFRHPTLP